MPADDGVRVPAPMCRFVAEAIGTAVRAALAAERERGGRPFPAAPYVALARQLRHATTVADDGQPGVTVPAGGGWVDVVGLTTMAGQYGRSARSLRRDAAAGRLPAVKVGRTWIVTEEDHE